MNHYIPDQNTSAVITAAVTVISGVLIYILGQIVQNFILKPIQDFRIVLTAVSHKMKFRENILTTSVADLNVIQQACAEMRDLSSNIESRYIIIPFKKPLSVIRAIPSSENVRIAAQKLIFLSNAGGKSGSESKNHDAIELVREKLNLTL